MGLADQLRDRPRLARLIGRIARTALDAVQQPDPPPPPAPPPPGAPARFARALRPGWLAGEYARSTDVLYERLSAQDVEQIERGIRGDAELRARYEGVRDETTRRHMVLAFGLWLGLTAAMDSTRLDAAAPPDDVHVMARGPTAAAGGLYEADLVVAALAGVGVEVAGLHDALDFGCSSGRVVRVLAAAYPEVRWRGCDPNGPAIAWAGEHLPQIDWFVSADAPPLPIEDGALDLVYAISIWSHFAPQLGLRWFEEMHRILRPGGHLLCTTHGLTSVALYASLDLRSTQQADEIIGALYRDGAWYAPEFGDAGDWGVVNPEWGTAFVSCEWLLAQLCPRWRVLEFAPGRNQDNQDVYVLERA